MSYGLIFFPFFPKPEARVAESVDAADLKSVVRKDVGVQVPPRAPDAERRVARLSLPRGIEVKPDKRPRVETQILLEQVFVYLKGFSGSSSQFVDSCGTSSSDGGLFVGSEKESIGSEGF